MTNKGNIIANPNIFSQYMRPVRSMAEYSADMDQAEGNKLELSAKRMAQQKAQQGMADEQEMRRAYASDPANYRNALQKLGRYKEVQALDASALKNRETEADIGLKGANTKKAGADMVDQTLKNFKSFVPQITDAAGGAQFLQGIYQDPTLGPLASALMPLDQAIQNIPQDPAQLMRWKAGYMNLTADKLLEMSLPKMNTVSAGNAHVTQGTDQFTGQVMPGTERSTPILESENNIANNKRIATEGAANRGVQLRGQNLADGRARERIDLDKGTAVADAGGPSQVALVKRFGKTSPGYRYKPDGSMEAIPGGPADLKNTAGTAAKVTDAQDVLALLDLASPLIDKSTNSYTGVAIDELGRAFGGATGGAKAAAQLRTLEGSLISKMPKMSGPQSDKDVLLYKQMAGQIGDRTIPAEQKKAAIQTIREINERHAGGGKPQRTVVRTGKSGGRKVVEYSDGTVEYAD